MEPTKKAPEIDMLIGAITGKDREGTIRNKGCMTCDEPNFNWRDELSMQEFKISGMCQNCQDKVFGTEEMEVCGCDPIIHEDAAEKLEELAA